MKTFTIIYKNENGTLTDQTRQGNTKKEMKELYKANGYVVIAVLTESDINKIKETVSYDTAQWQYNKEKRKFYKNNWWELYVLEVL